MSRTVFLLLTLCLGAVAQPKAKNVILFIGDAGGIPTLHAASIRAHGDSQKLFIQNMPYIGLSDTSTAAEWVTDSAAGMSAIVTGVKTTNGVISMGPGGKQSLKTILEYAEERGLSTGVISNMNITDATPAACYAHAASRKSTAEIFAHLFDPRAGNGPDVVIGAGRKKILEAIASDWPTVTGRFERAGYTVVESLGNAPAKRFVALFDEGDFDPTAAIDAAIAVLSKNPNGYFLMLEWDMHTDKPKLGLDRVIAMDDTIRSTAGKVGRDTLLLFTADHSFDLRLRSGKRGDDILPVDTATPDPKAKPRLRIDGSHTGEQVLVAAQGPGAERVRGFMRNTDMFYLILAAYGWKPDAGFSAPELKTDIR